MSVLGIHHVTAVSENAARTHDFFTRILGLRLVTKTVNQDDVRAYHLFYADAAGTPGTDYTVFIWPGIGPSVAGGATVPLVTYRAPHGSLDAWSARLFDAGVTVLRDQDAFGRDRLQFDSFDGHALALIEDAADRHHGTQPWIDSSLALRRFAGVELASYNPEGTARVLTEGLGFRRVLDGPAEVFSVGDEEGMGEVRVVPTEGNRGYIGAGGVHHVAFRVRDDAHLVELLERLEARGVRTSGTIDRHYFHSVYFREPGGVLFELATDGPGFAVHAGETELGERLHLPPFLECRRAEIEAGLPPLS